MEVRKGSGGHNNESDKLNEAALKAKPAQKEKPIQMYSKRREKTNPADAEIMKLRREGKEVPQDLLDRKFNFNKERHSKDLRRQHDFLVANYDMQ